MTKPIKKTPKPKGIPFTHKDVTILWVGVNVCRATYKGMELLIKGNAGQSRSLYIDGRRAKSAETIDELKMFTVDYLG